MPDKKCKLPFYNSLNVTTGTFERILAFCKTWHLNPSECEGHPLLMLFGKERPICMQAPLFILHNSLKNNDFHIAETQFLPESQHNCSKVHFKKSFGTSR